MLEQITTFSFHFTDPVWRSISKEAKDFIEKLLCSENSRSNSEQALNHPWIKDVKIKLNEIEAKTALQKMMDEVDYKSKLKQATF